MKCLNCNKGIMWGHRVSHSKRRTNHVFKPNLQRKTFILNGKKVTVKICTNCIKLYKFIDKKEKEALLKKTEVLESVTVTPTLATV